MEFHSPALGPSNRWRRVFFFAFLTLLFPPTFTRAQDVAEAARQERVRKAGERKTPTHVYTEQDLKRDKILTAEDRARVEARKKQQPPTPAQENAETLPADPNQQSESLGEIARRYRRQKEALEAEQAAKKNLTPFPYKVPDQSVASPTPNAAPVMHSAPNMELHGQLKLSPLPVPRFPTRGSGSHPRISPFQPRPLFAAPPAARVAPVNPPALPRVELPAPVQPTSSREMTGLKSLLVQRGDSWWKLAARYLGSGARWPELRSLNPAAKEPPEFLQQGSVILVPEGPKLRAALPDLHIVVRKGDTLWALARVHLGRGSAWGCLASANPQISDYTRLAIGSVLLLPSAGTLESCQSRNTERPQP